VFRWRTPNVVQGHYCVTVECYHPADREPANNVGQENTDVVRRAAAGTSPTFVVPFYNRQRDVRSFQMVVDAYEIDNERVRLRFEQIRGPNGVAEERKRAILSALRAPERVLADPQRLRRLVERDAMRGSRIRLSPEGRRVRRGIGYRVFGYEGTDVVHRANRAGAFPLPVGWAVTFPGRETVEQGTNVVIPPGSTVNLDVQVDVPPDAGPGEHRRINLTAHDPRGRVVGGVTLDILVGS
jgi:hypothetical protein